MSVELLAKVTPLLMFGESHSLVYRNMLFHTDWSPQLFMCRTRYLPELPGGQFQLDGVLHPDFARNLVDEGVLDANLAPAFLGMGPSAAFLAGVPLMAPPVVFFGCDMEVVRFYQKLGPQYDFELPDDPGYGIDRSRQPVPYSVIHAQMAAAVAGFVGAIAQLRAHRLTRVMVHCLPPRSIAEGMFFHQPGLSQALCAKLAVLTNRLLRMACAQAGIPFIDTWDELAVDGYLRPEYELDGLHVNRKAALVSLDKIAQTLFDHSAGNCNALRYQTLWALSQARDGADTAADTVEDPACVEAWSRQGLVAGRIDAGAVADLAGMLSYAAPAPNRQAGVEWAGWPRAGRPGVMLAEPSDAALAAAAALLGDGEARRLLHAASPRELTVSSLRPVRALDDAGETAAAVTAAPPGARRALLRLDPAAPLCLETLDGQPVALDDAGANLVVYDPQRLRHRLPPGGGLLELGLLPRLPGQPFRVMWSGLAEWPADPFQFSLQGMHAHPPLDGGDFSARAL